MMRGRLYLAALMAGLSAAPAGAQLASGYSGQSGGPMQGVADDYWYLLRQIGPCVAAGKPAQAEAFLAAQPGSAAETRAFGQLFGRKSNVCMRHFVSATFVRAHLRGAVAEGLYERRSGAPIAAAGTVDRAAIRTLHDFAACYIRTGSAAAQALLADTQLGSQEEADAIGRLAPGFKPCFPAGRTVKIDATEVRMALAEALYHSTRPVSPKS